MSTKQRHIVAVTEEVKVTVEHDIPGFDLQVLAASVDRLRKVLAVSMIDQGGTHMVSIFPIENPKHPAYTLHWHKERDQRGLLAPIYLTED